MADRDLTYFKAFYLALQPSLQAYAMYILHSTEDAVEVVNDVFLKIWDKDSELGPFDDAAAERLRPYAFRAVKNAALNKLRAQRKTWMQLDEEVEAKDQADERLHLNDLKARISYLTNQLPPRCKQVFMMSRVDRLSNKEIAELLEISVKTVENQMTKALTFFRKNLRSE